MSEIEKDTSVDEGMTALGRALRVSFKLLVLAMIASLFFFLYRSLFIVESKEVGLLFRFGRVVTKDGRAVLGEGPHFAWPYPVDEQVTVPSVPQTLVVDDLWYDQEAEKPKNILVPGKDGYVLTGDANVLHCRWTLRYRVTDPLSYTLQFPNAAVREATLKALLRNAVTNVSAAVDVDSFYFRREAYREDVRLAFVRNLTDVNMGIEVEQMTFEWAAPRNLRDAFESVTNAKELSKNEENMAKGENERLMAETKLRAGEEIATAESERAGIIASANADKAAFEKLYEQYRKNPMLFKRLYFQERMSKILKNLADIYVIDNKEQRSLYLELNPLPKKKKNDGGANE